VTDDDDDSAYIEPSGRRNTREHIQCYNHARDSYNLCLCIHKTYNTQFSTGCSFQQYTSHSIIMGVYISIMSATNYNWF
jgi:hypothetical protein